MGKITKEQVEKINAKLKQGFELDVYYYLIHNEKTAVKRVKIGNGIYATMRLLYMPEYDNSRGYKVETGRHYPTCHICKEHEQNDFLVSYGLGRWVKIGEPQEKQMFSKLQKLSETIDIQKMVAIAKEEPATLETSKALFC